MRGTSTCEFSNETSIMTTYTLTDEQRTLLPSEADVALYEVQGYYISKEGVIPDWLIEKAIHGSQRYYRGERDSTLPLESGYANTLPVDETTPRNNEFVSLQINELKELARYPLIGAIAARLTRSSTIRLLDDQLIWKPSDVLNASNTITGWHTDRPARLVVAQVTRRFPLPSERCLRGRTPGRQRFGWHYGVLRL